MPHFVTNLASYHGLIRDEMLEIFLREISISCITISLLLQMMRSIWIETLFVTGAGSHVDV